MKPHLHKSLPNQVTRPKWVCYLRPTPGIIRDTIGMGDSPKEAYNNWLFRNHLVYKGLSKIR